MARRRAVFHFCAHVPDPADGLSRPSAHFREDDQGEFTLRKHCGAVAALDRGGLLDLDQGQRGLRADRRASPASRIAIAIVRGGLPSFGYARPRSPSRASRRILPASRCPSPSWPRSAGSACSPCCSRRRVRPQHLCRRLQHLFTSGASPSPISTSRSR